MNEDVFPIQNGDIPMEFYTDGFFHLLPRKRTNIWQKIDGWKMIHFL